MKHNQDEVNRLMHNRRSVYPKEYSGARVEDAVVLQMLENANWAPSHKLTEPWRFVVFCDGGLQKFAAFQASCYKDVTTTQGTFQEARYQVLLMNPVQSSQRIAIGMKRDEKRRLSEIEEVGAVFCAVQNMYLTATAYGAGCYLSTGGITYLEESKPFFGLVKEDKILGFLHVGVPKGPIQATKRGTVNDKVTWVR